MEISYLERYVMKVMNIMLSTKLGGIQQVFCDYDKALRMHNVEVLNIIHPLGKIKSKLVKQKAEIKNLFNANQYDPFAVKKLIKHMQIFHPDIIIVHGNRAAQFAKKSVAKISFKVPVVAVCHNQRVKSLIGLDALLIILEKLRRVVLEKRQTPKTIYYVPNMVENNDKTKQKQTTQKFRKIPVIGIIGRLVEEKSIDIFIEALSILKQKNISFEVKIAGEGKLKKSLQNLVKAKSLDKEISFIGWIDDKEEFFDNIDIFCLPSKIEHLSISLLEAMSFAKPIITADSFGPTEVIKHNQEGLVVKKENPEELANAIETFILDQTLAKKCANNAFKKYQQNFTLESSSERLINALNDIWLKNKEQLRNTTNVKTNS